MKNWMIGLFVTSLAPAALATTHEARCEVQDGEALAWVKAYGDDIEIETKAVLRVYDRHGDMILKKKKNKSFAVDAFDAKKIFDEDVSRRAVWCELDLKNTEVVVHSYEEPTTVVHHHTYPAPAPVVVYKQPRRERVIIHQTAPTRVYSRHHRHYHHSRTKVYVKPKPGARIRVNLPPIRVRL